MEPTKGNENPILPGLIQRASAGDQEAFVELAKTYGPLITKLSRGFAVPEAEREDLCQEGLIGLYKAVMTYDERLSGFTTYCTVCARRSMISAFRAYLKKNAAVQGEPEDAAQIPDLSSDPLEIYSDRESYKALLERIDARLSEYENRVLRLFLTGVSHDLIAAKLGTNKKSVDNAISRIRGKLRPLMG